MSHTENARFGSSRKALHAKLEIAQRRRIKELRNYGYARIMMSGDKFWKKFNGNIANVESFYVKKLSNRYELSLAGLNRTPLGKYIDVKYYTISLHSWDCEEYVHDINTFGYKYDTDDLNVFRWKDYYREYIYSITCKNSKLITYDDLRLNGWMYANYGVDLSNSDKKQYSEYRPKKYRNMVSAKQRSDIQSDIINAIYFRFQFLAKRKPHELIKLKERKQ